MQVVPIHAGDGRTGRRDAGTESATPKIVQEERMGRFVWSCAAVSDVGRVRESNEDSVFCDAESGVFVVADGMGGHAAGEVASAIA